MTIYKIIEHYEKKYITNNNRMNIVSETPMTLSISQKDVI